MKFTKEQLLEIADKLADALIASSAIRQAMFDFIDIALKADELNDDEIKARLKAIQESLQS